MSARPWSRVLAVLSFMATGCDHTTVGFSPDAAADIRAAGGDGDGGVGVLGGDGGVATGEISATAVTSKATGNVVVAGILRGSVDLGRGGLISAGGADLVVAEFDQTGAVVWNRRYGDAKDSASGLVAADAAGNTFVTTTFIDPLDLGGGALVSAGGADVALAKLDPTGAPVWSRRYGDGDLQFPTGLVADTAGDVVVAVHFGTALPNEGTSLVKVSAAGDTLWTKTWTGVEIRGMAPTAAGGTLLAGWFWRTMDFGGGPRTSAGLEDIFVVELGPSGAWLWDRRFGAGGSDRALGLALEAPGDLFLTGTFDDTLDFGDGAPLVSVRDPGNFGPSLDMFVARLRPGGAAGWSRRFGDATSDQEGAGIAVDGMGRAVVLGTVGTSTDLGLRPLLAAGGSGFVARFDAAGAASWQTQTVSPPVALATTTAGSVLLAGAFAAGTSFDVPVGRVLQAGSGVFLIEIAP